MKLIIRIYKKKCVFLCFINLQTTKSYSVASLLPSVLGIVTLGFLVTTFGVFVWATVPASLLQNQL